MKTWTLMVVFWASLVSVASAQQVIEVSGQGQVWQTPDKFTFSLYIEEQGPVVAKLNQTLQHKTAQIQSFLVKQGISEKDIRSTQVSLRPLYRHTDKGREQEGFILSREIAVNLYQLSHYDKVLDGVMKLGATRINDFHQGFADTGSLYLTSLEKAVKDARLRAERIATTLGAKVGNVISISEQSGYRPGPMPVSRMMATEAQNGGSMPGQSEISASVTAVFTLLPAN